MLSVSANVQVVMKTLSPKKNKPCTVDTVRVTKEFGFEMAHALSHYDGACRNIHGHSYRLFVTVCGQPNSRAGHPKEGMVIDFKELKNTVSNLIVKPLDHSLVLHSELRTHMDVPLEKLTEKVVWYPFQPTCENLVIEFARLLRTGLPFGVSLHSIRLYETAQSYAEWFANDNPQ